MSVTLYRAPAFVSVRDLGAAMDGTTDDRAPLLAAIAAAVAAGGGTVQVPPGALAFTGEIDIPEYVNLVGMGDGYSSAATRFVCLDAAASIRFGEQGTASYGGISGNFQIDGDDVATTPLYCGRTLGRIFQNITVRNGAAGGALLLLEETQNCRFHGINLFDGAGDHLVFDRVASGNAFHDVESAGAGETAGAHVVFRCSAASVSGFGVNYPTNNKLWGGIFEQAGTGLTAVVHVQGGRRNHFFGSQLISDDAAAPIVKIERLDEAPANNSVFLHDCELIGGTVATGIDTDDASQIVVTGQLYFDNVANGYLLRDASSVVEYRGGAPNYASVTTVLHASSTGTMAQVTGRQDARWLLDVTDATAMQVRNDAGTIYLLLNTSSPQFQLRNGADIRVFSGNGTGEVFSVDAATGFIYFGAAGTSTTIIRTGTGSPEGVVTAPVGSLFLRTDGAAGSTLYSKESGTGNTGWGAR